MQRLLVVQKVLVLLLLGVGLVVRRVAVAVRAEMIRAEKVARRMA